MNDIRTSHPGVCFHRDLDSNKSRTSLHTERDAHIFSQMFPNHIESVSHARRSLPMATKTCASAGNTHHMSSPKAVGQRDTTFIADTVVAKKQAFDGVVGLVMLQPTYDHHHTRGDRRTHVILTDDTLVSRGLHKLWLACARCGRITGNRCLSGRFMECDAVASHTMSSRDMSSHAT